jgi:V/A-type H+/Na+-transporting ATPase subunit F
MLGFVIGDNEMVTGFRLVGVEGTEVTSAEEARQALTKALARKDLAVIIISEEFSTQIRDDINKTRLEKLTPLVLEVPGRTGPRAETKMSDLIDKTLGIRI